MYTHTLKQRYSHAHARAHTDTHTHTHTHTHVHHTHNKQPASFQCVLHHHCDPSQLKPGARSEEHTSELYSLPTQRSSDLTHTHTHTHTYTTHTINNLPLSSVSSITTVIPHSSSQG